MSNHDSIDHHDEAQEDILFPADAEAGIPFDDEDDFDDSVNDMSDDAEALASAGHGTDEDYGGFNEREDWDDPVEVDYERE